MTTEFVLFDVHDTLISKGGEKAVEEARKKAVEYLNQAGYPVSYEQYYRSWMAGIKSCLELYKAHQEINFYKWYGMILDGLGIDNQEKNFIDSLNQYYMQGFQPHTKCFPHAEEMLNILHKRYRMVITSNSLAENTRIDLKVTGLEGFFEEIVTSSMIGWRKPSAHFFNYVCQKMNINPAKAIMIGNDLKEDIEGALLNGLRPIMVDHVNAYPDVVEVTAGDKVYQVKVARSLLEIPALLDEFRLLSFSVGGKTSD
jgi:HAD superfamily hydrolase (TIGR01549 family)